MPDTADITAPDIITSFVAVLPVHLYSVREIKEHRSMYSKYMNIFTLSLSYKYIYSKFTKNPDSLYEEHHIQIYSG